MRYRPVTPGQQTPPKKKKQPPADNPYARYYTAPRTPESLRRKSNSIKKPSESK